MAIEVRRATSADVPGIVEVKRLVWPDESTDAAQIAQAILEPSHVAFAVADANVVVGFIDGFSTFSSRGVHRWEIDLLAVHPNYRGQRLGERLVRASTTAGRRRGATLARGLIQVKNIASQRTFGRCSYRPDDTICNLYVSPHRGNVKEDVRLFQDWHLIPVNTFSYRGLWLEIGSDVAGSGAEQTIQADTAWDLIGAVLPFDQVHRSSAVRAAGFTKVGQYQWWTLDLGSMLF